MSSIKCKVTWEEITNIYFLFTELSTYWTLLKLFRKCLLINYYLSGPVLSVKITVIAHRVYSLVGNINIIGLLKQSVWGGQGKNATMHGGRSSSGLWSRESIGKEFNLSLSYCPNQLDSDENKESTDWGISKGIFKKWCRKEG